MVDKTIEEYDERFGQLKASFKIQNIEVPITDIYDNGVDVSHLSSVDLLLTINKLYDFVLEHTETFSNCNVLLDQYLENIFSSFSKCSIEHQIILWSRISKICKIKREANMPEDLITLFSLGH